MEEHQTSGQESVAASEPVKSKGNSSQKIIWPLLVVLLIGVGATAYWWRDTSAKKQADKDRAAIAGLQTKVDEMGKKATSASSPAPSSSNSVTPTPSPVTPTPTPSPTSMAPSASKKESIIASITSGNTAALEGYMAASVRVVIAASEAAFDRTPAQAVADLKYLDSATEPWNFSQTTATLNSFKAGFYKDYFKDTSIVGVSADKKVVVFKFDANAKINGVFMAASTDLLTQ